MKIAKISTVIFLYLTFQLQGSVHYFMFAFINIPKHHYIFRLLSCISGLPFLPPELSTIRQQTPKKVKLVFSTNQKMCSKPVQEPPGCCGLPQLDNLHETYNRKKILFFMYKIFCAELDF